MIRIVARFVIKKDCIPQYQALARELADATRKEPGCIVYTHNQCLSDERVHCFLEEWKDQAAIDFHNNSEHFQRIIPQMAEMFDDKEMIELFKQIH